MLNFLLIDFDSVDLTGFLYNACRSEPGTQSSAADNTIAVLNAVDEMPIAMALSRALEILRGGSAIPGDDTWEGFLGYVDPACALGALHSQIETVP